MIQIRTKQFVLARSSGGGGGYTDLATVPEGVRWKLLLLTLCTENAANHGGGLVIRRDGVDYFATFHVCAQPYEAEGFPLLGLVVEPGDLLKWYRRDTDGFHISVSGIELTL